MIVINVVGILIAVRWWFLWFGWQQGAGTSPFCYTSRTRRTRLHIYVTNSSEIPKEISCCSRSTKQSTRVIIVSARIIDCIHRLCGNCFGITKIFWIAINVRIIIIIIIIINIINIVGIEIFRWWWKRWRWYCIAEIHWCIIIIKYWLGDCCNRCIFIISIGSCSVRCSIGILCATYFRICHRFGSTRIRITCITTWFTTIILVITIGLVANIKIISVEMRTNQTKKTEMKLMFYCWHCGWFCSVVGLGRPKKKTQRIETK